MLFAATSVPASAHRLFDATSERSGRGGLDSVEVFVVADLLQPIHDLAVKATSNGDVRHIAAGGGTVPVFDPRRGPDDVAVESLAISQAA